MVGIVERNMVHSSGQKNRKAKKRAHQNVVQAVNAIDFRQQLIDDRVVDSTASIGAAYLVRVGGQGRYRKPRIAQKGGFPNLANRIDFIEYDDMQTAGILLLLVLVFGLLRATKKKVCTNACKLSFLLSESSYDHYSNLEQIPNVLFRLPHELVHDFRTIDNLRRTKKVQ